MKSAHTMAEIIPAKWSSGNFLSSYDLTSFVENTSVFFRINLFNKRPLFGFQGVNMQATFRKDGVNLVHAQMLILNGELYSVFPATLRHTSCTAWHCIILAVQHDIASY